MTKKETRESDVWKVAIMQSFAIMFHQVNILFTVIVIFWLFSNRGRLTFVNSLMKYAVLGLILTGGLYIVCGVLYEHKNTVPAFTEWILGYTKGHSYWQPLSMKTPVNVIAGFSRAFIGGHFIFQHPQVSKLLASTFASHGLRDEVFLASGISVVLTWLLTIITIFLAGSMIALVIRFAKSYGSMKLHYHVINPLLLTLAVYSLFFCFWMPEILEFWILQMVIVWLLIIGMIPLIRFPFNVVPLKGIFILSLSLFLVNYFGSIRWLQRGNSDWYQVEVGKLDPSLTNSDIVFVVNDWILKDYVRYYSKAKVISTDDPGYDQAVAQKLMRDALSKNHKVIVYNSHAGWYWHAIQSD